ncbi:MAG: DUF1707 SHOCT-like domain-containing protein [Streptosporangiaceae bacterium]
MNTATKDVTPGDLRVSDTDRDRALSELTGHFEAGRLTAEELDERSTRALQAKTEGELADLFSDLPSSPAAPATPDSTAGSAGPASPPLLGVARLPEAGLARRLRVVGAALVVVAIVAFIGGLAGTFHGFHGPGFHGGTVALPVVIALLVVNRVARHHRR